MIGSPAVKPPSHAATQNVIESKAESAFAIVETSSVVSSSFTSKGAGGGDGSGGLGDGGGGEQGVGGKSGGGETGGVGGGVGGGPYGNGGGGGDGSGEGGGAGSAASTIRRGVRNSSNSWRTVGEHRLILKCVACCGRLVCCCCVYCTRYDHEQTAPRGREDRLFTTLVEYVVTVSRNPTGGSSPDFFQKVSFIYSDKIR